MEMGVYVKIQKTLCAVLPALLCFFDLDLAMAGSGLIIVSVFSDLETGGRRISEPAFIGDEFAPQELLLGPRSRGEVVPRVLAPRLHFPR